MRYLVTMTIDWFPPGTDVTGHYTDEVRDRLVEEGYLEVVDDEAPQPEPVRTARVRKVSDGS